MHANQPWCSRIERDSFFFWVGTNMLGYHVLGVCFRPPHLWKPHLDCTRWLTVIVMCHRFAPTPVCSSNRIWGEPSKAIFFSHHTTPPKSKQPLHRGIGDHTMPLKIVITHYSIARHTLCADKQLRAFWFTLRTCDDLHHHERPQCVGFVLL